MIVLLAVVALGLSAGAVLTEAVVLVRFWRSLEPEAFLAWYRAHAALLVRFFGPLEILAAVLALLGALLTGSASFAFAAVLAAVVLVLFPLYFRRVNASFTDGTIAVAAVPGELRRWSRWHGVRVVLASAAFVVAVAATLHR